jgi:hypothetical protein
MKAKEDYYFRKKVKQGKDYVMKDVKFDPFKIKNENGVSLGDLFERLENRLIEIDKQAKKIDKFIKTVGGVKVEKN